MNSTVEYEWPDVRNDGGAHRGDMLLQRTALGDSRAFAEFYDLLCPRVLALTNRILVDRAQSEEVTQEIFVEVWRNASRFDPSRGSATTWILTICHRRAIDRVRASQASRDRDSRIGRRDLEIEFDSVAERAEIRDSFERALAALATLPQAQREAVTLSYGGGYSRTALAEHLGVPVGTVKSRVRDGLRALRQELKSF